MLSPYQPNGTAVYLLDGYQHSNQMFVNLVRDNGFSTRLPDGTVFHVYGDTRSPDRATNFWFMPNTAALTRWRVPNLTLDAAPNGRPIPMLPWTAEESAFVVPSQRYWGIWPTGVTAIRDHSPSTVLISYNRVLVDTTKSPPFTLAGQGLARWVDDGFATTHGITAVRLNDDLFPGVPVQVGAPVYVQGFVYLYGSSPASVQVFSARAPYLSVADTSTWRWWNGRGYGGTIDQRAALTNEFATPYVQWLAGFNRFVMVTGRMTSDIYVRWSVAPQGPWSDPMIVSTPEGRKCYLPSARPDSPPGRLWLLYAENGVSRVRLIEQSVTEV